MESLQELSLGKLTVRRASKKAQTVRVLITIGEVMAMTGGEGKPKLMYKRGCAFILHVFSVEHIHASGMNLIRIASSKSLSGMPSPNLRA